MNNGQQLLPVSFSLRQEDKSSLRQIARETCCRLRFRMKAHWAPLIGEQNTKKFTLHMLYIFQLTYHNHRNSVTLILKFDLL